MKNKKVVLGFVVVLVAALGLGGFLFFDWAMKEERVEVCLDMCVVNPEGTNCQVCNEYKKACGTNLARLTNSNCPKAEEAFYKMSSRLE